MLDTTEIRISVAKYKDGMITTATETINIDQWQQETSRGAWAAAVIDSLVRRTKGGDQ